jgi:hypothetical protein
MKQLLPRQTEEIVSIELHEPPPKPKTISESRIAIFNKLAKLKLNEGVEINRKYWSMVRYVYWFRVQYGRELRYIVRPAVRFGWSKIWRVR